MTRVYLSGKMSLRPGSEVLAERRRAVELCLEHNLTPLDPGKNENIRDTNEVISISIDYPTMKAYVAKDIYAVDHCDVVLVLTGDTTSDGTWLEMGQAIFKNHIPVVMVAPRRCKGEIVGFATILCSAMFPTIEEAVKFIADNYTGGK
jgi:nucleoside 2-deoxyribosyltransferase